VGLVLADAHTVDGAVLDLPGEGIIHEVVVLADAVALDEQGPAGPFRAIGGHEVVASGDQLVPIQERAHDLLDVLHQLGIIGLHEGLLSQLDVGRHPAQAAGGLDEVFAVDQSPSGLMPYSSQRSSTWAM
jgi:hypothetical protein